MSYCRAARAARAQAAPLNTKALQGIVGRGRRRQVRMRIVAGAVGMRIKVIQRDNGREAHGLWPLPPQQRAGYDRGRDVCSDLGEMNLVHGYLAGRLRAGHCSGPACLILFG